MAGYEVIKTLLQDYITAINNSFNGSTSNYDSLILKQLPSTIKVNYDNLYERVLHVCHYVSLLSDSKAILNYRKIKGFEF